jgi:hypothetical protein
MSKILLNNLQAAPLLITGKPYNFNGQATKFIIGFSIDKHPKEAKIELISDILSTLLIYDKLFIPLYQLPHLLNIFKPDDVLSLLLDNTLIIINDNNLNPTIFLGYDNQLSATCLFLSKKDDGGKDTLEDIEQKWQKQNILSKEMLDKLIVVISKKMVEIDANKTGNMIENELDYDLKNINLMNGMNCTSNDRKNLNEKDTYKILRLLHINKGLAYANILDLDTILIDSEIRPILSGKIAPLLKNNYYESVDMFENLVSNKGVPNLGYLYDKGILNLIDIISLRNNIDGKIFRKWYYSIDYNQNAFLKVILNKVQKPFQNIATKHIRWIYPKIIGLVSPIAGLASSWVDSFVLEKILKGWHPSFFLDNRLKSEIDKKIKIYEREKLVKEIKKKFPTIGRNDICPCGSGKKFKKCCGR